MAEKNKIDRMKIRVAKFVERAPVTEAQNIYVGLNGRGYNIPRGRTVDMPLPVWEIVERVLRAEAQVEADLRTAR